MMQAFYQSNGITIFNGDCRDLILPEQPALVLADPPYGDDHDTDYTRFTGGVAAERSSHAAIAGDSEPFDPRPLLKIGKRQILFGCNRFSQYLPVGSLLIWDKRSPGGSKNVMSDAEPAWDSHGRGVYIFSHAWDGFNRASERGTANHPSQKPVAFMRWCLLRAKLQPNALVYDPYMGSGPVAKACKELGYRYIGCELVESYCEAAAKRLQQEVMSFV
jgi:site-specific DNA-methyltransferase (adenine-specific)